MQITILDALTAPVRAEAQTNYEQARDRYAAALRFAAKCSEVNRPRAMQAVEHHAALHRLAFHAQQILMGHPVRLSDPRD